MRWKIIIVNAGIAIVVALLTYVLLATSLKDVVANQAERKREVAQALIGYLPGDFVAYPKLTGRQYLAYLSRKRNDRRIQAFRKWRAEKIMMQDE